MVTGLLVLKVGLHGPYVVERSLVACRVPASAANIGPGFDAISLGLETPSLMLELEYLGGGRGIIVEVEGAYADKVPRPYEETSALKALRAFMRSRGIEGSFRVRIDAGIPIAKGLGSSGAEAVGAVVAADALLGLGLSVEEKILLAASAEPGSHADNVVASLLGGFNIVDISENEVFYLHIKPPRELGIVVVVPEFEKESTEAARSVLDRRPGLSEYSHAVSRSSMISAALALGRLDLALRLIPLDPYVEVARANAGMYGHGYDWPKLEEEKRYLMREYGVALCISGAGPSRLLLYDKTRVGERLNDAVNYIVGRIERFTGGVQSVIYTEPSQTGTVITRTL